MRSVIFVMTACAVGACGGAVETPGDEGAAAEDVDAGVEAATSAAQASSASSAALPGPASLTSPDGLSIHQGTTVMRFSPDGTTPYSFRPANEDPNGIDHQDCEDDVILQFTLDLGGLPTTDTVQAWAGTTDCSQPSARAPGAGPYCWQAAPTGEFAGTQVSIGNLYARDILRFVASSNDPAELAPDVSGPGSSACQPLAPPSACYPLYVYFLLLNHDGVTADAYTVYPIDAFGAPPGSGACAGM